MDWLVLFYVVVYCCIGSFLSDFLEKGGDSVMAMVVFIAWPAVLLCILLYIIIDKVTHWRR